MARPILPLLAVTALAMLSGRSPDPGEAYDRDEDEERAERGERGERDEHGREVDERPEDTEARGAWWAQQRAFPGTRLPADAWARAREPFRAERRRPRDGAPIAWKPIGPAPLDTTKGVYGTPNMSPAAGRASTIVIDPNDPKTLYAGFALGGVWKSSDRGATWTPLTDLEPTLAIGSIAIDPTAPGTIYVGTGEPTPYIGYLGQGIYKSTDGGKTFTKIGGAVFDDLVVGQIVLDPAGGAIYASAFFGAHGRGVNCNSDYDQPGQGLYQSTDGGATWKEIRSGKIIGFQVDTTVTPRRIFVSDYAASALLSEDGGSTWSLPAGLPNAMSATKPRRIEFTTSAANPSVVYAGMGLGNAAAVFVSTDGGKSFAQMPGAPDYCQTQCYYDNAITADPTDEKTLWLGGNLCGVWKSTNATDAAPTWVNVSMPNHDCKGGSVWYTGYVHPDVHRIAVDPTNPNLVYAATDGGIAGSKDGGATWTQLNAGVGTLQIYALCGDPKDANNLYGGAQDNGAFMRDKAGWHIVVAADGGPCAVDPADSKKVLASTEYASIVRTTQGFATTPTYVFDATPGGCQQGTPGCGDRVGFIAPLTGDPSTPGTFYVGTYRVWKNDAGGAKASWKAISPDLTAGASSVKCPDAKAFGALDDALTVVQVAPSAPAVLYTGSQGGRIFTTKDGGATWTRIDKAPLPGRWVTGIAIDPRDPQIVFASFSGFGDNTPNAPGHVFRSADGGATWELRDIPADTPVDALIPHPFAVDLLYAGTDGGVLYTADGGKTWSPLGDALPAVPVFALVYQRTASTLVAGTFGRSAWSIDLPKGALTASPDKLTFSVAEGGTAAPQKIQITTTDPRGAITHFTAASGAEFAAIDQPAGDVAGTQAAVVSVTPTVGKLTPGDHDTTITFTPEGGGAPITVPVRLTVTASDKMDTGGCGCRVGADGGPAAWRAALALAAIAALHARRKRVSSRG